MTTIQEEEEEKEEEEEGEHAERRRVKVDLEVTSCKPKPRALELFRQNNSGTATLANSLYDILQSCQLEVRGVCVGRIFVLQR